MKVRCLKVFLTSAAFERFSAWSSFNECEIECCIFPMEFTFSSLKLTDLWMSSVVVSLNSILKKHLNKQILLSAQRFIFS